MKQNIRIIGGSYRGKKISFPNTQGLRPTPERVRETLFNWLMYDIRDLHCLDAFAGSGALGLEAFSRGAGKIVFVEQDKIAHSNLKIQTEAFNSPKLSVLKQDACSYLQQTKEVFDLIFLDPPFNTNILPECLEIIENNNTLIHGGLIYIESSTYVQLNPLIWQELKLKRAGQVIYGLYRKI